MYVGVHYVRLRVVRTQLMKESNLRIFWFEEDEDEGMGGKDVQCDLQRCPRLTSCSWDPCRWSLSSRPFPGI